MKKFITFLFIAVLLSACGKYEEGPNFSLLSKRKRIINDWQTSEYYKNGALASSSVDILLTKDDTYEYSSNGFVINYGDWSFDDKKEHLELTIDGIVPTYVLTYKILKLEKEELWLESEDGSAEYHMIPK